MRNPADDVATKKPGFSEETGFLASLLRSSLPMDILNAPT